MYTSPPPPRQLGLSFVGASFAFFEATRGCAHSVSIGCGRAADPAACGATMRSEKTATRKARTATRRIASNEPSAAPNAEGVPNEEAREGSSAW